MEAKKTIQKIKPYPTSLFEEEGYLKLDVNESDFGPSPKVLEALRQIEQSDIQYYPYYGNLLQKLANFHSVNIENIILTDGADEAIGSVLGTFLEYNQTVLTIAPSFIIPKIYSKAKGLNYKEISYKKKWEFPADEFIKNINNADLIYLTTPNSPTGEIIERKVIEKIIEKADGKPILIDETYTNYAGVTNLDLLKNNENIFIIRSFSKDFALAGLRLGYIISAAENIKELRKYLAPYNVSKLTVKAGLAALDDIQHLENVKIEMEKSKELLTQGLQKIGATVYSSKANFICVDFGKKAGFVDKKLIDNKIKVKYFDHTPLLENCFRITVPRLENTKKILEILKPKPTIVFDIDGVLIDASKSYRVAVQKTFNHFSKKEISLEDISAAKKLGGLNNDWDMTEFFLKKHGFNINYDAIVKVFQSYYDELADTEMPLVNHDFFQNLSKNYNLAVFTGRTKEEASFTLGKHNFTQYFYPIITMDDVGFDRQKPDCLGLEIIKEKVIADKIYYLGDTVDDMECAKIAKICAIGVLPPQDKSDELKNLLKSKNAMVVLNQTTELIKFLEDERDIRLEVENAGK